MPDSKNLTDKITQGDLPAFLAELYAELPDLIQYDCWQFHYFPRPDEIEDLRAEIIVQLLEHDGHLLQTFDADRGTLSTWLHTVVRN